MGLHQPIPAGTRPIRRNAKSAHTQSEGKNRLFDNEIHLSKETSHRRAGCPQPAVCSDVQMVYTAGRTVCAQATPDQTVCGRTLFALQDIWCKTMSLNKQALRFHHLTKPERPFIITDIRTAFTLVRCGRSPISLELEENAAAFLGGGYFSRFKIPKTTVASSIRSVSTSIVVMRVTPLFWGNNLAVPYQHNHYIICCRTPSIQRQHGVFFIFTSIFTR